jgi:hypothetical protein
MAHYRVVVDQVTASALQIQEIVAPVHKHNLAVVVQV